MASKRVANLQAQHSGPLCRHRVSHSARCSSAAQVPLGCTYCPVGSRQVQGLKPGRPPAQGADAVLICQAHHPVGGRLEEPATSPGCSVAKHDHNLPHFVLHIQPSAACLHLQQQSDASVAQSACAELTISVVLQLLTKLLHGHSAISAVDLKLWRI